MSSKLQYRDALKRDKQLINNLRIVNLNLNESIVFFNKKIKSLEAKIAESKRTEDQLRKALQKTKRWCQIFIKIPKK